MLFYRFMNFVDVNMLAKSMVVCRFIHSPVGKVLKRFKTKGATVESKTVSVLGTDYQTDHHTNVTPAILNKIGKSLHTDPHHPIGLIKLRIQDFFYKSFIKRGNPVFSVYDNLSPVVTLEQNFDNLLVPKDHPSRDPKDSYYLNSEYMLRAHTTAHQRELIKTGLNSFLVAGDVYRRDTVDQTHYPAFHQLDGVNLYGHSTLFKNVADPSGMKLFGDTIETELNQEGHTIEAALLLQQQLQNTLENLAHALFGLDVEMRWVDESFPFTHPSWELEVKVADKWVEVLGCGIMRQQILNECGASEKVGWAFGLGLERLAMKLYNIPDIRLFWSEDPRFRSQFKVDDPRMPITFKPLSFHPPILNNISFFIPEKFAENDFYDIVRSVGGNLIEEVSLVDTYFYSSKNLTSMCYKITYRHTDRVLSQEEVNVIHKGIADTAAEELGVTLR